MISKIFPTAELRQIFSLPSDPPSWPRLVNSLFPLPIIFIACPSSPSPRAVESRNFRYLFHLPFLPSLPSFFFLLFLSLLLFPSLSSSSPFLFLLSLLYFCLPPPTCAWHPHLLLARAPR